MTRRGETLESDALAACASEPIQHSGAIQPHGCLLSCGIDDLVIRHVSTNTADLFDMPPEELSRSSTPACCTR